MTKIWYKVIEKRIPGDPNNATKWYASVVPRARIKRRDLIDEIARTTALMKADVSSVMEAFLEEATRNLLAGHTLELGELGTLYVIPKCNATEDEADFTVNNIDRARIRFRPSMLFKKYLNAVEFEPFEFGKKG